MNNYHTNLYQNWRGIFQEGFEMALRTRHTVIIWMEEDGCLGAWALRLEELGWESDKILRYSIRGVGSEDDHTIFTGDTWAEVEHWLLEQWGGLDEENECPCWVVDGEADVMRCILRFWRLEDLIMGGL